VPRTIHGGAHDTSWGARPSTTGGVRKRRRAATGLIIVFTFLDYFSTIGGHTSRSVRRTTAQPRAAPTPAPRRLVPRRFLRGRSAVAAAVSILGTVATTTTPRTTLAGRRAHRGRRSSAFRPISHSERHTAHTTPSRVFTRTRSSMTTPAAVPQGTSSRSPNSPAAAGHSAAPGGRLRGEAPGRRTSRLVPASPATTRLGAFTNSRARTVRRPARGYTNE
jgi:hypothetical protein